MKCTIPFKTKILVYRVPRTGVLVAIGVETKVHLRALGGGPLSDKLSPTTLSVWKFLTWVFSELLYMRSRRSLSSLNFGPSQDNLFVTNLFLSQSLSSSETSLSSELVYSTPRPFLARPFLASSQSIWSIAATRRALFCKKWQRLVSWQTVITMNKLLFCMLLTCRSGTIHSNICDLRQSNGEYKTIKFISNCLHLAF